LKMSFLGPRYGNLVRLAKGLGLDSNGKRSSMLARAAVLVIFPLLRLKVPPAARSGATSQLLRARKGGRRISS
jgi:hypothetical protein